MNHPPAASSAQLPLIVRATGFSLACLVLLCGTVTGQEHADVVLWNGQIVTVNDTFDISDSMAIRQGRIAAIGSNGEQLQTWIGDDTTVIDLQGKMVLPGLLDSHTHPTGASLFEADHEIPTMDSIDDVLQYVRQRATVVPEGEWIYVSQVFITRLREQRYPTRAELDQAAPRHPVLFRTGPDGSVNSLALQQSGIDQAFAKRHPTQVLVDPVSGEPTGILRQVSQVITKGLNQTGVKVTEEVAEERLLALFEDYNRHGITGVIDRNCSDSARARYERLQSHAGFTLRVRLSRSLDPNSDLDTIYERLDAIAADPLFQSPQPRLGVLGVKCFQDGGMLTGSAFFTKPWGVSTIYGIEDPNYRGMRYIDQAYLEKIVAGCVQRKLAFTAHCQGDAAVEALLDVYQSVNETQPIAVTRSTVTHSSFMSPRAIEMAARLKVGIDLQPAWLYLDARTLEAQFGDERLKYFIPLRSLMEAGVVAGGGSDHMQKIGALRSVNPYSPFLGMWVAVTRQARWHDKPVHLEQALDREQMIRFYTINNAWLMRMEDEIGSLEAGKRADFIIIDRDLLNCPAEAIRSTEVLATWLDGKQIFPGR